MIPETAWLSKARSLAVGMKIRVRHGNESRENMVIANAPDKWWCYCQRCHEGGVVEKDHVVLTANAGPIDTECKLPDDIKPVLASEFELPIAKFLASKNMDQLYLPELLYSEKRKRLMLRDFAGKWHGRDLTNRSPMKWMNYGNAKAVGVCLVGYPAIVVEDLFSMYKVQYATKGMGVRVVCALGTGCSSSLVYILMPAQTLVWMFDGDLAGDGGSYSGMQRMRPFVERQVRARPPEGLDPKDMSCQHIRDVVTEAVIGVDHETRTVVHTEVS